ncbi:MAG: sulfotransferase [Pseudomonadota bacterium]
MTAVLTASKISSLRFRIVQKFRQLSSRVNEEPIIVLGNQKSGTSAIVSLLGEASKKSYTNDIFTWYSDLESKVLDGRVSFDEFVRTARFYFSRAFIKDPGLTFLLDRIDERFPSAKYVFVVRNPLTNIRSILNRLNLPGDLTDIGEEHWEYVRNVRPNWQPVLTGQSGGYFDGSYIERLAHRCRMALEIAFDDERWKIVRYEDFLNDKVGIIQETLKWLELPTKADISPIVDQPFQPASTVTSPPLEFFGDSNHQKIIDICGASMRKHGYTVTP